VTAPYFSSAKWRDREDTYLGTSEADNTRRINEFRFVAAQAGNESVPCTCQDAGVAVPWYQDDVQTKDFSN